MQIQPYKELYMISTELKIRCRIEEVPTIGGFLSSSLNSNLADFTAFSPNYNAAYVTNFNTKLNGVTALINPKQLTAELKVITLRIYTNIGLLRPKIDFLEGYIKRASGLTIAAKDFGISAVRTANNKGDVEGLISALGYLLTNVSNNMASITAQGYNTTQHTALTTMKTNFTNDNTAQNTKLNDRNNNVVANHTQINAFWALCTDISDAGKRIYKSTAPNKVDDFSILSLLRRIRQEQKKNKFDGIVSLQGKPLANAKIELIPVTVGRRRTTKSNAKGEFIIKSLTEGDYVVNVSAAGQNSQSSEMKIETGKETMLKFEMGK